MIGSIAAVPWRIRAPKPVRRWAAETHRKTQRRVRAAFNEGIDLVVGSLIDRETVHRVVDDILRYLIANPNVHHLIDDIVDYISRHPAVRALVQQQGAHLTDEVIDEARQHIYRADTVVDGLIAAARRGLRRRPSSRIDRAR